MMKMFLGGLVVLVLVFLLSDTLNAWVGEERVYHLTGCVGFGMAIRALWDQIKLENDVKLLQAEVLRLSMGQESNPRI